MSRQWSLLDFVLIVLGGFLGAGTFLAVSLAFEDAELLVITGLAGQYLGHLAVFWLLARRKQTPAIGFSIKRADLWYLPLGLLLQLVLALLFIPLTRLFFPKGDSAQEVGDLILSLETTAAQLAAVFTLVVLAPVVEEVMFRGVLLKSQSHRPNRAAIWITALVFALFHVLGLAAGQLLGAAVVVLPRLFIIGIALAWATLRTGRLGPAIFMHSGVNLLAALLPLIPPEMLESVGG